MSFYRKSYRPRRGGEEPEKCADPAKARARALDALSAREMTSTQLYERLCARFTEQAAAAAANTPLRSFPEEPDMLVKNGRYGAYIAYKGKNYRLPKGAKPEELTLDDCLKIVAGSKK